MKYKFGKYSSKNMNSNISSFPYKNRDISLYVSTTQPAYKRRIESKVIITHKCFSYCPKTDILQKYALI